MKSLAATDSQIKQNSLVKTAFNQMPERGNESPGYYVPADASIRAGVADSLSLDQKRDATTQTTDEDFSFLEQKRDKSTQTSDEDFIPFVTTKDSETQTSEEDFELITQINSGGFASTLASKTLQKNKRKIISGGSDVNKRSRREVGDMSEQVISTSSDTARISSDSHMDISASSGQTGMEESHSTVISPEYLNIEESYPHDEDLRIPSYLVNKRILNTIENDALSTNPQKENATDIKTDSEKKVKSVFLVASVDASFKDIHQSKLCAEKLKHGSPLNMEAIEIKQKCYKFKNLNFQTSYFDTARKIYCDVCKVSYSDVGSHDSNPTCNVCKKIFECKMQLEDHYLTHEEFHETYCRICNSKIDKHETVKGRREYQCCECGYRTGCKAHLLRHLYIHSSLRLFKCEYCGMRFKQTTSFRGHFKNFHPVCELCGKRFVNNNSLDEHRSEEHS